MPTLPAAATTELGQAGVAGPAGYADRLERTRELIYPASLAVYDQMRRSDAGIRANLRAMKLPILATDWRVVGGSLTAAAADARDPFPAAAALPGAPGLPDGSAFAYTRPRGGAVRPEVCEFVTAELGLTRDDDGRVRSRPGGVVWSQFLSELLAHLDFGHYPFEQVYAAGAPDTPGLVISDGLAIVAHLRKLAPRPPLSLASIDVASDGGLEGIHQYVTDPRTSITRSVPIPVDRLVMFTNEREAANWHGLSVLRSAYKHWMIKDTLIRLSAIAVDRTGMGLPVATYDENVPGSRAAALKVATSARVGEDSGLALPSHVALQLLGVTGSTVDPLPLIRYHEQAASKAVLAMFLDLGHDAGARSLGDTFLDYFLLGVGAVVRHIEDTVTDHVVRDLVRLNFGENEPWPVLRADPVNAEATPTADALSTLAGAGLLGPIGEEVVNDVRRRYDLPALPAGSMQSVPGGGPLDVPGAPGQAGIAGQPVGVGGADAAPLPGAPNGGVAGVLVPGMPTPASAAGPVRIAASAAAGGGWDDDLSARVSRLSATLDALRVGTGAGVS